MTTITERTAKPTALVSLRSRGALALAPVPTPDPKLPEGYRYEQVAGVWRLVCIAEVEPS